MLPAPRRWPAGAFLICSLLAATDRASALPGTHPEAALGAVPDDATFLKRWQDPLPGSKAYVGFHERGVLDFGPVTVTSTLFETITHVATQTATVLVVVVETSTVVRTTETTISNAETQTKVIWITTTEIARQALPTSEALLLKRDNDLLITEPRLSWTRALRAAWTSVSVRRLPHAINDVLERRQATREPSAAVAPTTATVFATQTVDFTSVVSTTITSQTTSFVMTTVIMTNTIVLNAKTTVDVTSTMTITSHQPVTQVITTTESPIIVTGTITAPPNRPPTTGATSSSTPTLITVPPTASSSIQTPAIVGIAVGGTVGAIIVASIAIFFIRHRRKYASSPNPNADLPPDVNELDRQPTFPVLTHFAPAAPAAHHASGDFTPPPGQYLIPNNSNKSTPAPGSHHRSSSGYSTLVSAFPSGNGNGNGNGNKNYRVSAMTAASVSGSNSGVETHEIDSTTREGNSSSENPSPGTRSPPPPMPPPRNPYRGHPTHIVQTEPGELDGNERFEIGSSSGRQESDEDGGLLRVPGVRGQRSWGEEQRYDGDGYGTPESRSPSVAPGNWGK
ncbi:hypothetical protein OQA88_3677 [Cercophora sp. LCS_1]